MKRRRILELESNDDNNDPSVEEEAERVIRKEPEPKKRKVKGSSESATDQPSSESFDSD